MTVLLRARRSGRQHLPEGKCWKTKVKAKILRSELVPKTPKVVAHFSYIHSKGKAKGPSLRKGSYLASCCSRTCRLSASASMTSDDHQSGYRAPGIRAS